MIVSYASSIRFRKVDSNYANFDNTLLADELFYNDKIFDYCQRWLTTDTVTVQLESDSDTLPTATATKADGTEVSLTVTQVSSYDQDSDGTDDLFFFAFDVDMSVFTTKTDIVVTQGSVSWKSEPFKGDSDLLEELQTGMALEIEYYNNDNAFEIDFSSGAGSITYKLYVPSILKDLDFGGESSVYDNQDELEKLKETVQRLLTFRTTEIPRYLAETLKLASSMDNFVINGVAYVRQDQPELSAIDGSNLVEYSMTLVDKEYLGVNTHDIGFDCDAPSTTTEIMVLVQENASGSVTFNISGGYLIHTLKAQYVSGTTVEIKLGSTVGGEDLAAPYNLTASLVRAVAQVHGDESESDYDVYATVTGGVADLTLQLLKNKE